MSSGSGFGLRPWFLRHHEYWPMWAFYAPLAPWIALLALRHRGLMTFTCCNPGIENGGGLVGESKSRIMARLPQGPAVLTTVLVPPGAVEHRECAVEAAALGWPIILKPDQGQRGHAVRLARSAAETRGYFRDMPSAAVAQPYHAGPEEAGILWVRDEQGGGARAGRIFSITRKEFPVVVGDGARTLRDLIRSHPRYRFQAPVFLARLAGGAERTPARGERVRLAVAGNHCQGTLFRDGADLITPPLEAAIDALAAGFEDGLDFGRFDVRYTTDDALRRGEGFAVVELNGITSESTNLYDPDRSLWWAYGVLFEQWRAMYTLGARRRVGGTKPVTMRKLADMWRRHRHERCGSAVSD